MPEPGPNADHAFPPLGRTRDSSGREHPGSERITRFNEITLIRNLKRPGLGKLYSLTVSNNEIEVFAIVLRLQRIMLKKIRIALQSKIGICRSYRRNRRIFPSIAELGGHWIDDHAKRCFRLNLRALREPAICFRSTGLFYAALGDLRHVKNVRRCPDCNGMARHKNAQNLIR